MKRLATAALFFVSLGALADCESSLALDGMVFIEPCDPKTATCKSAAESLHDYMELSEDSPAVLTIGLHTSPWRMYDADMRILTVEEMAAKIRPSLKGGVIKRVELQGSWTAVAPDKHHKSLAERLSKALNGFPVGGTDGFLWISKDGSLRTTHQAFTVRKGAGPYRVRIGGEVMASLVAGWSSDWEEAFVKDGNSLGVMHAGAGWDIHYLCPERALAAFELAANMSNPIAAYNAALIRLDRGGKTDRKAAIALLSRASELGDQPAQAMLRALKGASP